ncbi:MAG: hypothetical protein ACPGYL_15935, partial [Rhodospirillaceae bacterium]
MALAVHQLGQSGEGMIRINRLVALRPRLAAPAMLLSAAFAAGFRPTLVRFSTPALAFAGFALGTMVLAPLLAPVLVPILAFRLFLALALVLRAAVGPRRGAGAGRRGGLGVLIAAALLASPALAPPLASAMVLPGPMALALLRATSTPPTIACVFVAIGIVDGRLDLGPCGSVLR